MLDNLYVRPTVLARHRAGPLLTEREQYLDDLAERGHNCNGLRKIAWMLLVIASSMPASVGQVSAAEIERVAREHSVRFCRHKRVRGNCSSTQRLFVKIAISWFDYLGRLRTRALPRRRFAQHIQRFERFMSEERGLSAVTIHSRCQRISNFVRTLPKGLRSIRQITIRHVDHFLVTQGSNGWSRSSLATLATDLRSFFRYAEAQGWCRPGIATAIDSPRIYCNERLPRGPCREDVQALIENTTGEDPVAVRDHAIILLLALYGLRRGEVARLRLDDIDWQAELLRIERPKQRRVQSYPLIQPVGDALVRYLQEVRPRCTHRHVFLAMKAPLRPLSPESITPIVRWRLGALGVDAPHCGPHGLRHACAQHLLAEGFSLKQIGDQLGHRRASVTSQYAKVDLAGLRQVAELDLRWLL